MLGLKHNINLLADYDPDWPVGFSRERERIGAVLGDLSKGIEHYGSTAVPGMRAKPILDILVGIALIEWRACKVALEGLGYNYAPHGGVPGHYIFGRGRDTTERTYLVHLVEFMGPEWVENLALRDALRRDGGLRDAYTAEKERAVAVAPRGRAHYNEIKGPFIDRIKAGLRAP